MSPGLFWAAADTASVMNAATIAARVPNAFIASPFYGQSIAVIKALLGRDRIHRNVVRQRVDRWQMAELEADAEAERPRIHGFERTIVEAAAIAEPIAVIIEADQRHDQHLRLNGR